MQSANDQLEATLKRAKISRADYDKACAKRARRLECDAALAQAMRDQLAARGLEPVVAEPIAPASLDGAMVSAMRAKLTEVSGGTE